MLESEIKKLTVAVEANTAALTLDAESAILGTVAAAKDAAAPADASPVADAMTTAIDIPVVDVKPEVAITLKMITEGIVSLCKAKNREAAAKLMAEYGAAKVPDLKKVSDKYPEILAKINALISAK